MYSTPKLSDYESFQNNNDDSTDAKLFEGEMSGCKLQIECVQIL
jgi:hypothetical protein